MAKSRNWKPGGKVYRFDGGKQWIDCGRLGEANEVMGMAVYRGKLYATPLYHDGKGLYTTGLGHGDAMHVSHMDPDRPGLQVFQVHEKPSAAGIEFRDGDDLLYTCLARNNEGFREINAFLSAHNLDGTPLPRRAPDLPNAWVIWQTYLASKSCRSISCAGFLSCWSLMVFPALIYTQSIAVTIRSQQQVRTNPGAAVF